MKRFLGVFSAILVLIIASGATVFAESTNYNVNTPYYSYTYNASNNPIQTPAPYTAKKIVKGRDLGIEDFAGLTDVFYDKESEQIYLTDSLANAIIVLNKDYELVTVIREFNNQGKTDTFKAPQSTCARDGKLYVADTENARILRFDSRTFELQKVLTQPEVKLLGDYKYKPYRLAIDLAGRIYVIATDINDGILLLDENGSFIRFAAAPDVKTNLWTKFLKLFMTKAQKQGLEKAVPTEYSSIYMDGKGFLYLTSADSSVHPVTKLNSQGTDILKYEGESYPDGDASYYYENMVATTFVDIAVRNDNIYAVLDTEMGRVFLYDQEGSLLYAFGGVGAQKGTFYAPSAIDFYEDTILVTDNFYGTLTVFRRTDFGNVVENATNNILNGNYEQAKVEWKEVVSHCPSYEAANVNLARIDIQERDYKNALEKLLGTTEWGYYSKAFEGVREDVIGDNFTLIFIGILVFGICFLIKHILKKKGKLKRNINNNKLVQEIQYSKHTMFHPFDGFWDLKREKRGSLAAANVLVLLFILTYALRVQFSGYLFTGKLPGEINTLYEIVLVIVPLGLWVVSNWCFTSLMEGEGTMKDIYIGTAYALRPYIITAIPMCLLSHCLSGDEAFIYTTINAIVIFWMLALIFLSMMVTHDYSLLRAIIVTILTLLGMLLILFLALTFANVVQKIYDFAFDIYRELIYRAY